MMIFWMFNARFTWRYALAGMLCVLAMCDGARAGGGPENVLVVVNSRSWASLTVANHFCRLRRIPPSNVFYLDWPGSITTIDVETFRQKILAPIVEAIEMRRLGGQIDYVVYSSDFPYAIQFDADVAPPVPKFSTGSLTSLTYLSHLVRARRREYARLKVNWYMRPYANGQLTAPTSGFRASYGWQSDGHRRDAEGQHYLLSTMLAYTSGRGNSVEEAIRYLRRSALADGSHPGGTIYFAQNENIRSKTRHGAYPAVVEKLTELGVAAAIVDGRVPRQKRDIRGCMTGIAQLNWGNSENEIRPGAICDNLTSFGGVLREKAGQTPLSAYLRYGAAGTSGTVVEPYAIENKFPHPMIHVHYVRGCTLAEAFYQSVSGPYQLLIVGDPLCRPWATIPMVFVDGVEPGTVVNGVVTLAPRAETPPDVGIGQFEIFLDGRRQHVLSAGERYEWDTRKYADGHHELRIVAIDDTAIESQGRLLVPVKIDNHGRIIRCQTDPAERVRWDETLKLTAHSPGSKSIMVFQNHRLVGRIAGERGELQIDPRRLGTGPVLLVVVGLSPLGAEHHVFAAPIRLEVTAAAAFPLRIPPGTGLVNGLRLKGSGGTAQAVDKTVAAGWLSKAGVKTGTRFELSGYFQIEREEVYQFQAAFTGDLEIHINGKRVFKNQGTTHEHHYVPVSLKVGWHRLQVAGKLRDDRLGLSFGGTGTQSVDGKRFRHPP